MKKKLIICIVLIFIGSICVVNAKEKIYTIKVETSKNLDFIIDPKGLLSLGNSEVIYLKDLKNKGDVVFESDPTVFIENQSDFPVIVSVGVKVEDTSLEKPIKLVKTNEELNGNNNANMLIGIETCSKEVKKMVDKSEFVSSGNVIPVNKEINDIAYYNFYLRGLQKKTDKFDERTVAFKIFAKVNSNGDWIKYLENKENIAIKLIFNFYDVSQINENVEFIMQENTNSLIKTINIQDFKYKNLEKELNIKENFGLQDERIFENEEYDVKIITNPLEEILNVTTNENIKIKVENVESTTEDVVEISQKN